MSKNVIDRLGETIVCPDCGAPFKKMKKFENRYKCSKCKHIFEIEFDDPCDEEEEYLKSFKDDLESKSLNNF